MTVFNSSDWKKGKVGTTAVVTSNPLKGDLVQQKEKKEESDKSRSRMKAGLEA